MTDSETKQDQQPQEVTAPEETPDAQDAPREQSLEVSPEAAAPAPQDLSLNPEEEDEDDAEEQESEELDEVEATLESVTEAVLFASDEPVKAIRLCDIAEAGSVKQIRQCVKNLNQKYRKNGSAFRIEKIAGGYQMMTLPAFNHWLSKLIKVRTDNKLSPAALETLAIIAYKQPIIRADVEAIRGVASGEVIRNLMYKGLVKIVGRAEVLGRPMQYGTSKKFLEVFGLNSIKDLPNVEELKNPQA